MLPDFSKMAGARGRSVISGVVEGLDGLVLGELSRTCDRPLIVHVARDDQRAHAVRDAVAFFAPELDVLHFPAWDCLPYDRISPAASIVARRLATLSHLVRADFAAGATILVTTANALIQKVPPADVIRGASFSARPGNRVDMAELQDYLTRNGFSRTGTVVDPGDYAVRGGIVDIFPPGRDAPVRLDFFGDTLESLRSFDPQSQRSTGQLHELQLDAANEVLLTEQTIARFRTAYAAQFGGEGLTDALYEAVSAARRYPGMEHWLPLYYPQLQTLLDYCGACMVTLDHNAGDAMAARHDQIREYYDARCEALDQDGFGASPYKPVPPEQLFIPDGDLHEMLDRLRVVELSPFELPPEAKADHIHVSGRKGRSFAAERAEANTNLYEAVVNHVQQLQKARKRAIIAAWSEGSRERLATILKDHNLACVVEVDTWPDALRQGQEVVSMAILGMESGFELPELAVIAEQDILGDRLVRRARRRGRAGDFISELSSLTPGDLVVHVDHGIGRFEGLKVIDVQGAPHDCLFISYHGGDRLFLPVENIDLLSRYGSDEAGAQLDRLGGAAWQARKARLKERVREIAEALIRTAAERELRSGEIINPPDGLYDEFSSRFPFEETEDQLTAIDAVMTDLGRGRPMDRLICGDVGFGKTEVALRTAFVAVMAGKQVAVVVPTTLLARQHHATFKERFAGLPVHVAHASRLVSRQDMSETRKGLASGDVDIVVGTHALLSEDVRFRDLGLLIIDEEQHFGVKHKEKLKQLRSDVHVLTLTATPIPRTLQLALSGVRELSLITTPPLDRLAVRTYISPFDPVVIRETLLRELYRGGQSFYVVPRISDLSEIAEFLATHVPEVKFAVAHGRMPAGELDDIMTGFYDQKYNALLATTIVESGLDIPTANTLIVHRADMFGLAQLYQLRGRVGRSKQRAYALFTLPPGKPLSATAEKRLNVLQSLDSLGAGFTLASHDLDIRGSGNLLGEEQSGHIREVGFELYQQMLEEAVASLRSGEHSVDTQSQWSPQINIGTSVLLPESFIPDLQVRLGVYRRLADLDTQDALDGFAAELQDRFGKLPEEVEHLLEIVLIKMLCRTANVESVDAGPKGAVLTFKDGTFPNPDRLVGWINEQGSLAKIRPDMKLVIRRQWDEPEERLKGTQQLLRTLVGLAD